jgi:galactose mutarotase-like enzyme
VQIENSIVSAEDEFDHLRSLDEELREAIRSSLYSGRSHLAVALDTARDFVETVLAEDEPTPTRIAVARARAEIALEVWREANSVHH